MKHVQACLSAREDRECSIHCCGCPVWLVQAWLCTGKTCSRRFNLRGCAVKLVKACFSDSEDQESSFHHCGSPVRLVQACLCAGKN